MCSICESEFRLQLSCGCENQCQDCSLRIIFATARNKEMWGESIPACFIAGHSIPTTEALEIAKGSEFENEIEYFIELRPVFKHIRGISFCPDDCGYAGWVNVSKKCYDPVECENCGNMWMELQLQPLWYRIFLLCRDLYTGEQQFFRQFRRKVWSVPCPFCQVPDEIGFSGVIACLQCRFSYCNKCGESAEQHHYCDDDIRALFQVALCLQLAVLLAFKILYVWDQREPSPGAGFAILLWLTNAALVMAWFFACFAFKFRTNCFLEWIIATGVSLATWIIGLKASQYSFGNRVVQESFMVHVVFFAHCLLVLIYLKYS